MDYKHDKPNLDMNNVYNLEGVKDDDDYDEKHVAEGGESTCNNSDDDSSITRPLPPPPPPIPQTNRSIFRKGSLHIIPATLAKIAHVPMRKNQTRTFSNNKTNTTTNDNVGFSSLDCSLENRLETFLDIIDPEATIKDRVGMEEGHEEDHDDDIDDIEDTGSQDEDTDDEEDAIGPFPDETLKQPVTDSAFDVEPTLANEENNEETLLSKDQSSIADCICPFPSPFEKVSNNEADVVDENSTGTDIAAPDNERKEFDTAVDHAEEDMIVDIKSPTDEANVKNKLEVAKDKDNDIDENELPFDLERSTPPSDSSTKYSTSLFSFKKFNAKSMDADMVETRKVLEINPEDEEEEEKEVVTIEPITDTTDGKNDSNQNDTNEVLSRSINPPAKWSIFTPFVTKYLVSENNMNSLGEEPDGKIVNDGADDVRVATENKTLDPTGIEPILCNKSVDKSITPPWNREDPPTDMNASDVEVGKTNAAKVDEDICQLKNYDIECTRSGLFVSPTDEMVLLPFDSSSLQASADTKKKNRSLSKEKGFVRRRCHVIFVIWFILLAALSAGIYFYLQSKNESTKLVSASTTQSDSIDTKGLDEMDVPSVSPSSKTPTTSPVATSSNKPTRLPTTRAPVLAPVAVSPMLTKAPVKNDAATNNGNNDDNLSTDDGSGNDDDGSDDTVVPNTNDDDGTMMNDDDGSDDNTVGDGEDDTVGDDDDSANGEDDDTTGTDDDM